jgi:hypothetical protein
LGGVADEKVWSADIDREKGVELLNRHFLKGRVVRYPGIQHENVQPFADAFAKLLGKSMRALWSSQIRRNLVSSSALPPYFIDHGLGLLGVTTVVDDNLRTGCSERQRRGTTDAPGRSGDKGSFAGEVGSHGIHRDAAAERICSAMRATCLLLVAVDIDDRVTMR